MSQGRIVRPSKQDHFLIGSVRQRLNVRQSSLPDLSELPVAEDRLASLMAVAYRIGGMQSARQACEDLLQDALDGGGTDNITITVGRAIPR